ncbi:hypothetical protein PCASD_11633 [Puccinia coronata f. sp. avenae]|uniref:ASTRA-associated protein 1 n=1 Tax=Puccinia coronata f. sp. avenae TaxID=200324 RepID=A0A2N5TAD3_9BASI|nr:hypothetical protein PCASD_11633 [Puccinia coronata f. sp. avenae]
MALATRGVPPPVFLFRPTHQELHGSEQPTRTANWLTFIAVGQHRALLAADSHGWISLWSLHSNRIQSLWHPHPHTQQNGGCLWAIPLLAEAEAERDQLFVISQGRDHRLVLSHLLNYTATCTISTITRANLRPTISAPSNNITTVAHAPINAINFCKASSLDLPTRSNLPHIHSIVALPSLVSEELVDIFAVRLVEPPNIFRIYKGLGNERRTETDAVPTGSVVAVQLFSPSGRPGLVLLMIGYESGEVRVLQNERLTTRGHDSPRRGCGEDYEECMDSADWARVGHFKGHTEPILSLTMAIDPRDPLAAIGWSVGADRNIVRYHVSSTLLRPSPTSSSTEEEPASSSHRCSSRDEKYETAMESMVFETNQCGRFDVKVRADGKLLGVYTWGGKLWLFDPTPIVEADPAEVQPPPPGPDTRMARRFSLRPLALLKLPTEPDRRSGVLAFAPFPLPHSDPATSTSSPPLPLDSLAGLALLVASGTAGQITAWEVFPPPPSPQS